MGMDIVGLEISNPGLEISNQTGLEFLIPGLGMEMVRIRNGNGQEWKSRIRNGNPGMEIFGRPGAGLRFHS